MNNTNFAIRNKLRKRKIPNIDFETIKNMILGKSYSLSLLICSDKLAKRINKEFRNKDYIPNTLSFRYQKNSGEIIINAKKTEQEARSFDHSYKEHFIFLFIHSLLHLKGHTHGSKMEKEEKRYLKKVLGNH